MSYDLNNGYLKALDMARNHYENFPVISFLIPKDLRKHIAIFYWFARSADDIADEGNLTVEERIEKLDAFKIRIENLLANHFESETEFALANTIKEKNLSVEYFFKLLEAFKQDTTKSRFENYDDLLLYCDKSANPVGRIILELFDKRDDLLFEYSDKICTALQITNFLQDVLIDFQKGRIYLPKDEMEKFGVTEKMFELKENNLNLRRLTEFTVNRTELLFNEGKELVDKLKGGLKLEINWTINGGKLILKKIRQNDFNLFAERPIIKKPDIFKILLQSIFNK